MVVVGQGDLSSAAPPVQVRLASAAWGTRPGTAPQHATMARPALSPGARASHAALIWSSV